MSHDLFPLALREKLRPAGAAVPHPGAFPTVDLPPTTEAALAQFAEACEAVGGRVSRVATAAEAAAIIVEYLDGAEWRPAGHTGDAAFVSWDAAHLPLPDVLEEVLSLGYPRLDAWVHPPQTERDDDYRRLDGAIVGITGAHAALADTGTVALVHGPGRPRLASLLPPVHVALVAVDRVRATLGGLWRDEPAMLQQAANVVLVTGPSRTADIEMTLTRGVHGPRLVHVVFVG